jgi:hypothetical protein
VSGPKRQSLLTIVMPNPGVLINRLKVAFLRGSWNLRLRPHGRCELATAARTGYPGQQGALQLGRALMLQTSNVYTVRMAGVFMISLGTIGMRTRLMPRWLVLVSYLPAGGDGRCNSRPAGRRLSNLVFRCRWSLRVHQRRRERCGWRQSAVLAYPSFRLARTQR